MVFFKYFGLTIDLILSETAVLNNIFGNKKIAFNENTFPSLFGILKFLMLIPAITATIERARYTQRFVKKWPVY